MHDNFEVAVSHLEKARDDAVQRAAQLEEELAERLNELDDANKEIERLGLNVFELEEELKRLEDRHEREIGEALDQTQLHEEMSDSLKEVRGSFVSSNLATTLYFCDIQYSSLLVFVETGSNETRVHKSSR